MSKFKLLSSRFILLRVFFLSLELYLIKCIIVFDRKNYDILFHKCKWTLIYSNGSNVQNNANVHKFLILMRNVLRNES